MMHIAVMEKGEIEMVENINEILEKATAFK